MLQDLLDLIGEDGVKLTIIPVELSSSSPKSPWADSPVLLRSIKLLDRCTSQERIIRKLDQLMRRNGYETKADALKNWWVGHFSQLDELINKITAVPPAEADLASLEADLAALNDALETQLVALDVATKAIVARQAIAICEVDIEDLLV